MCLRRKVRKTSKKLNIWSVRLSVRTSGLQPENRSSILLPTAIPILVELKNQRKMNGFIVEKVFSERLYRFLMEYTPISVKGLDEVAARIYMNRDKYGGGGIIAQFDNTEIQNFAGDYFDLRNGEISFHPNPSNQITNPNGKWSRSGRQILKIGKLISILQKRIKFYKDGDSYYYDPDNQDHKKYFLKLCESLTNKVNASVCTDEIKISEDPSEIYKFSTYYAQETNPLTSSCMRPESNYDCHEGVDKYTEWKAKIAYITHESGLLRCRALVWENTQLTNGNVVTFMDRIYGNDTHVEHMKSFAEKKGWWYKIQQDSCSDTVTDGTEIDHVDCVSIPRWVHEGRRPYMDTFVSVDNDTLYAHDSGNWNLQCTCATFIDVKICPHCGEEFEDGNGVLVDGIEYCENCTGHDDWNNCYALNDDLIAYYNAQGYVRYVHRDNVEGLVSVRIGDFSMHSLYCEEANN